MLAALGDAAWGSIAAADCTGPTINDATIVAFRKGIAGEVVLPNSPDYASARLLYNRRFGPRPLMVVRAVSEEDIARTIAFSRTNGIRLSVRSGGHSYIGASGCNGVILDLSSLNEVAALGGARFRIGAGARLVKVYGDLACGGGWTLPCGSCDSVGFSGIALGGGFGYLQRAHGLTCDRVRSVRVVRADGTAVTASADSEPDLFWALRGGGAGLCVATAFEVDAVPLATIHVAGWNWPISVADDALAHTHALVATGALPRHALGVVVFGLNGVGEPSCTGLVFSTGSLAEVEAAKQLFVGKGGVPRPPGTDFAFDLATPACNPLEPTGFDYYKAKSSIVSAAPAPDTAARIASWLTVRANDPRFAPGEYCAVNFLTLGGAVGDIAPAATAFPHRQALSEVQYLGFWNGPSAEKEAANLEWLRGMYADVAPRLALGGAGCYVNYADDDLAESEWPELYFGANYPRLQAVKRALDPADFFRGRQTVRP